MSRNKVEAEPAQPVGTDHTVMTTAFAAGGAKQPFYVVRITGQNHRLVAQSDCYNNGVNHICRSSLSQQAPGRGVYVN